MNEIIMRQIGFNKEMDRIKDGKCPICNKEILQAKFKNALSRKEYKISGVCQKCQDKTFTPQSEDPCEGCKWKSPEHCKECPI